MRTALLRVALGLGLGLLARADGSQVAGQPPANRIRPQVLVLPTGWADRLPPTGAVNAPEFCDTLYPGQPVVVGFLAEGPDRERLFDGANVHVRLTIGGEIVARHGLQPAAVRAIKAQGADFVLLALKAAGIDGGERAKLEAATALVTLTVVPTGWTVPPEAAGEIEIAAEITGGTEPVVMEPARLKVKTVADWLQEPPLPEREVAAQFNRYRSDCSPGQLLAWLTVVAKSPALKAPPVHGYFARSLAADPTARAAAVAAYAGMERETQPALLWVLRLGGADLAQLMPTLPAEDRATFDAVEPLLDPRKLPEFRDPVDPQEVAGIGHAMDQCWAGWMATGDPTYLRALVGLLAGAGDFGAFQTWQRKRGGAKGLNASVARGLYYQIAGWSISSFQRTDPLVADWLTFWQTDPATPEKIRQELAALPTNPAFRRK